MTLAFEYRPRKGIGEFTHAAVGATVVFGEQVEYVLNFPNGCTTQLSQRLRELGGELIASDIGALSFGNFVGRTEFAGATIEVVSSKIGSDGVSRVLEEISDLASSLIYGWRSPTSFDSTSTLASRSPVPYHQLQFLRRCMLRARTGERLQDWLAAIDRNPIRQFEPERPVVSPERVRRLDHRSMRSIFARIDRLAPVPAEGALFGNQLAQALTFGDPPQPHFPTGVAAPRSRLSFDTPENRFIKHVIGECLAVVYRFVEHPQLHASFREDCRQMLSLLEHAGAAPYLAQAARLVGFHSPSQALAKADGYREVFRFWNDLNHHVSLPRSAGETIRLLEGRNIATLYEYWVFLKVLEAVVQTIGVQPLSPPTIQRDELGESLAVGLSSRLQGNVLVRFNPTFMRSTGSAYSTPLRPDVIVEIDGHRHAFDAKYRLDRFETSEDNSDDGMATYKRADLYKMHTYRDAIARLQTAFVVYPGSEFVFFDRSGAKCATPMELERPDGVGAIPLRPIDVNPATSLRGVVEKLFTQRQPTFLT